MDYTILVVILYSVFLQSFFINASYVFSHSILDHILSCPYYCTTKSVMTRLSCDNLSRLFFISTHSSHHFSSHPTLLSSSPWPLHLLVSFLSCPLLSPHMLSFLFSIIFSFYSSPILFSWLIIYISLLQNDISIIRDPQTKTRYEYDRVFAPGSTQLQV